MQSSGFFHKTGVIARLVILAAACGALVAGLALPMLGSVGLTVRNAANNFTAMATPELGQLPVRSKILDRHGKLIAYYYGRGVDRVPVSFGEIAPAMRQAIVAIEDSRFWQHGAIDFRGTIRALVNNLRHQPIQGGSTLAQQYVKNVLILSSKDPQKEFTNATGDTLGRKIRELRMAMRVEHTMSKEQVLTGYLNAAYYGNQAYGIQVAAHRYFATTAAKLTLPQAALLAGLVENPAAYNPLQHPKTALERRNTVLARMVQVKKISAATARKAEKQPLRLHPKAPAMGCTSPSAKSAAYFCDYVLSVIQHNAAYKNVWQRLNGVGGLRIYTTLNRKDQAAARRAVNYQLPAPPSSVNPGKNAASEVLIQPGTGQIMAMANDRPYGTGPHQNTLNYAVGTRYNGTGGVQIGSSGKVYTLVAALEQGIPFGYTKHVKGTATITGFTNCKGQPVGQRLPNGQLGWHLTNDQSELNAATYSLYTGTADSINTFFAPLEKKVGLCNVVKTAAKMGLTWPDGTSLLKPYAGNHHQSADNDPAFTLGSDNVTPLSVAAADATLPARGIACQPIAIRKIVDGSGKRFPVESAHCHRVMPAVIADAANYVLQGDLTQGTATGDQIGRPAASKTGTADKYTSAFFVGYTPDLLGAVWVGNPTSPQKYPMVGVNSCYRAGCVGSMYGSQAPGQTWQQTFLHAALANPPRNFVAVPSSNPLFSKGDGRTVTQPKAHHHRSGGGGGGGNGGGGHNGGGGGGTGTGGLGGGVPPIGLQSGLLPGFGG